jgi:hypothetical protein
LADAPMKVIVQNASYNSSDNVISFECETPVAAGTMVKYPYYWPSSLSVDHHWPPTEDIASGNAGGGGIGSGAVGLLPVGFVGAADGGTIFVGGPNVIFGSRSDWGDRQPTDSGFTAQPVSVSGQYANVQAVPKPALNLTMHYLHPSQPLPFADKPSGFVIDLATTLVMDSNSDDPKQHGYLRQVFALNQDNGVVIDLERAKLQKIADEDPGPLSELLTVKSGTAMILHNANIEDSESEDYGVLDDVIIAKNGTAMLVSNANIEDPVGDSPGQLDSVIQVTNAEAMLKGDVKIVTNEQPDGAEFDFKFDEDGAKFGAGTAFLKD